MIGVVIPYFQRAPGLLAKALSSIDGQVGAPDYVVYVVDDSSPSPPELDLRDLPARVRDRTVLLSKPNGGPGSARNFALDRMPAEVDVVAFLDSDDAWTPGHLARVSAAMAAGADLYFADYLREDSALTQFAKCAFEPQGATIPSPSDDGPVRWCDAGELTRAVIERSPIGTPTVALRRATLGDIRFRSDFRAFGEDILFWLEALKRTPQVAASAALTVRCGRGVNIAEHGSWGDERAVRTIGDQLKLQAMMLRHYVVGEDRQAKSRTDCRGLEADFVQAVLAMCRRGKLPPLDVVARVIRARPQIVASSLGHTMNFVAQRRRAG